MKIKVGKPRVAWKGKYNRVFTVDFVGIDGRKGLWEFIQRNTYGAIAVIIPVTAEGEVLFIKHFRVPRNGYVLESPGGLMDQKGEKPSDLARRELLEETGYKAKQIKLVASGANNGGLQNEDYNFFVATGCVKVAEPAHESAEDIELIKVPLGDVESFLARRRNFSVAAPLYGVPYFLRRLGLIE